jgi:hypothetical protein
MNSALPVVRNRMIMVVIIIMWRWNRDNGTGTPMTNDEPHDRKRRSQRVDQQELLLESG